MALKKQKAKVIIKGVKDGLIFHLDDRCEFQELIGELTYKLKNTHQQILSGPQINVSLKLGSRPITEFEEAELKHLISSHHNLVVTSVETMEQRKQEDEEEAAHKVTILAGIVRSGQIVEHEGNLLYIGDVNPGGSILCSGDIYVMGSLRGMAHAGINGEQDAVIAASYFAPTQLRIAGFISRPPEEWNADPSYMEFAYIKNGVMEIDKIVQLHRIRPNHPLSESSRIKGE